MARRLDKMDDMRLPKILIPAVVVGLLAATGTPARAAEPPAHAFGLGIELGAPSGLAAKYYLGSSGGRGGMMALQAGLGVVENWGPDGIHFHLDVVWHPTVLARTPGFTMPFYFGVGGRILDWNDDYYCRDEGGNVRRCYGSDDTDIGLRVPVGILMDFHDVPIDVFFELALVMDFIRIEHDDEYDYDHDFLSLDGVIGARFYF
jgi:hypothetical protein